MIEQFTFCCWDLVLITNTSNCFYYVIFIFQYKDISVVTYSNRMRYIGANRVLSQFSKQFVLV